MHFLVIKFTYLGHVINWLMTNDDDVKKQMTELKVIDRSPLRKFSFVATR